MSNPQDINLANLIEALHEVAVCLLAIEKSLKDDLAGRGLLEGASRPTPYICGKCGEALTPCNELDDRTRLK